MAKVLINQRSRKRGERKLRIKKQLIKIALILSLLGNIHLGYHVYDKQIQIFVSELQGYIQHKAEKSSQDSSR